MRKNILHKKSSVTYIISGILMILAYAACNNSNNNVSTNNNSNYKNPAGEQKISLLKLLLGSGNNLFRSVDLGTDFKTVLSAEKKIPDENDTDDISYTMPIDTIHPDSVNEPFDSVNYFKITYYFDREKLNEIDEDIYLESDSSATNLLSRLTDYFSSKYGDYASQNDSRVWSRTHKGKKEWISLSDQSEEYDNGKLLLVLYSEEY
ncbi:MAG TPA: hypothetical protein VK809_05355 [Bacteroidia bacterium]|jgi:hypothetical protein|nr:hypothetical protein [Bacteroidia bacterium]